LDQICKIYKRNKKTEKEKEERKNIKGPRVTVQPSSRIGPRPSKQTETVPSPFLSLPLTVDPTCHPLPSAKITPVTESEDNAILQR
jgi:hypothetical protein